MVRCLNEKRNCGGEGGIRTLGTLIRGTHDFQSCTFNRSVTSPLRNFKDLPGLPHSSNGQCLQNVSMGMSSGWFRKTYHGQKRIAKLRETKRGCYTIVSRVLKKNFRS